jgi:DNA-binding transcriptional MerR regulator
MVLIMNVYTSKDACRLTRIRQRVLILFCERGVVIPFKDAAGQGSQRLFSFDNLIDLMIALQMWRFKINLRMVKDILDLWRAPSMTSTDRDLIILRNFDSGYTGCALTTTQNLTTPFFDSGWPSHCEWVLVASDDPTANFTGEMTSFSTMLIDVKSIVATLKKNGAAA